MGNNLKALRKAAKKTQAQAADETGMSKGGYVKIEDGDRRLSAEFISRAAKAFGVREADIIQDSPQAVPVMGRIGAGAEIEPDFEQVPPDGFFEVETGLLLPEGMIGFEVVGPSMLPRYDEGDIVICSAKGIPPENLEPGEEAAVRTSDGKRFLKKVHKGPSGYTLISHNAEPIYGVQIEWASEVATVVRRKNWRRLNGAVAKTAKVRKK